MIKIENVDIHGWDAAIRGMRNPMNSWVKSDSEYGEVGPNDHDLMMRLVKGGPVEAKFRRMIIVTCDILAPLYWWKEFDTYKVGTVANSCSTMHKIHEKEFTLEDFSHEHLLNMRPWEPEIDGYENPLSLERHPELAMISVDDHECYYSPSEFMKIICTVLNRYRELYLQTKEKCYWWQMIQLLPSSYNQRRTVQLSYEVLANIYPHRKNHKLDEWRELCEWIKSLPYAEIIIGGEPTTKEAGQDASKSVAADILMPAT